MAKHVHMIVTMSFSLAWSLRFTPRQRVYLLSVLTLMFSSELVVGLVRLSSFSNIALSSLSVLGNVVPPTDGPSLEKQTKGVNWSFFSTELDSTKYRYLQEICIPMVGELRLCFVWLFQMNSNVSNSQRVITS